MSTNVLTSYNLAIAVIAVYYFYAVTITSVNCAKLTEKENEAADKVGIDIQACIDIDMYYQS